MTNTKQAIIDTVNHYKQVAQSKGYTFPHHTKILFNLKGACAGRARKDGSWMKFNLDIASENLDTFLKRTVPHEMAHILQFQQDKNSKPHGDAWKHFCRVLTGSEMPRCHSYKVSHLKRRRTVLSYTYKCSCSTYRLSSIKHNRCVRGEAYYTCLKCKCKVTKA